MNINSHSLIINNLDQLIHNATLMNIHKSSKFVSFLVRKKIVYGSINCSEKVSNILKVIDLFEEKYGEQYDLEWRRCNSYNYSPIFKVLYPKFTITNSRGQFHEIRDLVVIHEFKYSSNNVFTINSPHGARLSKTTEEIISGYQQSHLSGYTSWTKDPFEATQFCVGNETDVSMMLAEFTAELDWGRLELYLYCVDSMITWESLEGVPFRYMSNITNSGSSEVYSFSQARADIIISHINLNKIPLDADFYVKENRYKIAANKRFSDFIKSIILEVFSAEEYREILVTVNPNNSDKYLAMGKEGLNNILHIEDKENYTLFNGRKIYPKIINQKKEKEKKVSIEDYIVHPKFLEYVSRELEYQIYQKALTNSATRYFSASSNANRGVTSDTVSL